jgi:cell division protein FtsB
VALLFVLAIVAVLYVQDGLALMRAKGEADQQGAIVNRLQQQNAALTRQARSLQQPATIEREARVLGMVKAGERPYVITGLPNR